MQVVFFETPAEFRAWLEANHETATELWVGFHKKATGRPSMVWSEAVDQALCFGWIDGIRKSVDAGSYANRFTPRKARSTWSNVNIEKVARLTEQGLMMPAGRRAFEARDPANFGIYSFEQRPETFPPAFEAQLQANAEAWAFWQAQPPGYRRTATFWVLSAKREETRRKRLATLIEDSAQGRRIGLLARPPKGERAAPPQERP
jgi:uncharacterized protein YdeI (YjbR/CyaY-like superfamily)